jgi:hypothetical protein
MKKLSLFPLLSVVLLAGCSTPETRLKERPASFERLGPADRQLVLHGHIHEGMTKDAVYIGWGGPNQIRRGFIHGRPLETWIYIATETDYDYEPGYVFFPLRYHHRIFYDEIYRPIHNTYRYMERMVTFENGRVVAWVSPPY